MLEQWKFGIMKSKWENLIHLDQTPLQLAPINSSSKVGFIQSNPSAATLIPSTEELLLTSTKITKEQKLAKAESHKINSKAFCWRMLHQPDNEISFSSNQKQSQIISFYMLILSTYFLYLRFKIFILHNLIDFENLYDSHFKCHVVSFSHAQVT